MNWRISITFFFLVLSACGSDNVGETESVTAIDNVHKTNYLIEVEEFKKIAIQPNTKIVDFRKKEDYEKGHIKDALHIWRTDLEDKSYPYGGVMASAKQIEALFSTLGINSNDTILIYDDNGLCNSARLWWILQNYNFTSIKLLNGGINEWKANGGLVSSDIPSVEKTAFRLPDTSSMKYYVSKEDVIEALQTNTVILDTRTLDEFSGKRQKKGAVKAGRIPESIHIDWAQAINFEGDKKIKTIIELDSIYSQLYMSKDDPIIVYCHSGVRSAHTTFILTQLLNFKHVKNYDGSWTEWSYFSELPFEINQITQTNN